ncbi:MAG TPA: GGDEF domain-containing protein [Acidobacteriaceae bacterium]|jgi:diguanylate cyclase (GGDEF)-like protein|nr:GGDEF domain-containing protein [Acidobacteriaceae bacterium]
MLTYAIAFVQDVQLVCFAVILTCMSLQDRANRSLRWLAWGYVAGSFGAFLDFGSHVLPHWISWGVAMEAAPLGYACFYMAVACFVRRGIRARWLWLLVLLATLPFYLQWSGTAGLDASSTLQDAILALETACTTLLLLLTPDRETRLPRRAIAAFLGIYSAVEATRVALFLATGQMPDHVAPSVEVASGLVYVVSCSVLPLGFIWMMNARLLVHLNRQSMIDPLTELLNRRGLQAAAEVELARYARSGHDFAVVVLDIDFFKLLNDRFGHPGGDAVLCQVSHFLRNRVRETDIVGRLGGEEFVLILPGFGEPDGAGDDILHAIDRIRMALAEKPIPFGPHLVRVTASFGVTVSNGRRTLTWELLQSEADRALYAAKAAGRNVARLYDETLAELPVSRG